MSNRKDWQTSVSVNINEFSAERMADFERNGIKFMELTGSECEFFDNFSEKSKTIFKTARDYGVKIRSVHLPFAPFRLIDPASSDKDVRNRFIEVQNEVIKISADRGAEVAVVHPSGEPYREEERIERLKCSVSSLATVNETANNAGIKLAIENLPRTCIMRDFAETKEIAEQISDAFFCFDSNHSLKDTNAEIIRVMGERIIALHISDYDFIDERHLLPGEGKNNWQEIMKELEDVGYSGTWNYEIKGASKIPASEFKINHLKLLSGEIK